MTETSLPSDSELQETGYILAIEEMERSDSHSIPDMIDSGLLIDVSDNQVFRDKASELIGHPELKNRLVLCTDPKAVWEAGMGGMSLFKSSNQEGGMSYFMIFECKRSAQVQSFVEEFLSPKVESKSIPEGATYNND